MPEQRGFKVTFHGSHHPRIEYFKAHSGRTVLGFVGVELHEGERAQPGRKYFPLTGETVSYERISLAEYEACKQAEREASEKLEAERAGLDAFNEGGNLPESISDDGSIAVYTDASKLEINIRKAYGWNDATPSTQYFTGADCDADDLLVAWGFEVFFPLAAYDAFLGVASGKGYTVVSPLSDFPIEPGAMERAVVAELAAVDATLETIERKVDAIERARAEDEEPQKVLIELRHSYGDDNEITGESTMDDVALESLGFPNYCPVSDLPEIERRAAARGWRVILTPLPVVDDNPAPAPVVGGSGSDDVVDFPDGSSVAIDAGVELGAPVNYLRAVSNLSHGRRYGRRITFGVYRR